MQISRIFVPPYEGAQSPWALCSACTRVFVSIRLFPPSEGVWFLRVFCSPSEGARSPGVLCSAYARVSVSIRHLPPSEGVQISRIFCSPSEDAQSPGTLCRTCARVSVSIRHLPPSKGVQISRIFASLSEGAQILNLLQTFCRSFCTVYDILPIRRCRVKWPFSTTFSFSLCANPHQGWLSVVLPWFPAEKVTVKGHTCRHLFGSMGDKTHLRPFEQNGTGYSAGRCRSKRCFTSTFPSRVALLTKESAFRCRVILN